MSSQTRNRARSPNEADEAIDGSERLTIMLPRVARVLPQSPHPSDDEDDEIIEEDIAEERTRQLKVDHQVRPLWISSDGHVFVETRSPLHGVAQDFLTAIAEPVSRPLHVHEYRLTPYSLYAAVSVGLETETIVQVLDRLCKTPLEEGIVDFVRSCTLSYGKVKLVLNQNRYWMESTHASVLAMLLQDAEINDCRMIRSVSDTQVVVKTDLAKDDSIEQHRERDKLLSAIFEKMEHESDFVNDQSPSVHSSTGQSTDIVTRHSFEVRSDAVERVKKRCIELDYPMLEEYDFRNDTNNPALRIDLRASTIIRPYQERCLSKMFGNGRARSGIIVLPCGAGKTLVGITAACTIRKSTLILCTSGVAVEQWRQQILHFANIPSEDISRFTSDHKDPLSMQATPGRVQFGNIVISTYTMVAYGGKRSYDARQMMDQIQNREWGLLILDEVHVVPANVFRRVLTTVATHCKLGLTATLVREDDKIDDLNFLIGPKLYEANWLDLARQGHIANVQCAEVWCSMPGEFYREYLAEDNARKRRLLSVMNPEKMQACHFLINYHEQRGDKIIVFSDNVYALKAYAMRLKKPHIYGGTSQGERMRVLHLFQTSPLVNTLFLSKVGDTSIDLPEATCLIQISSHYGSRRQEAQRLGRILRAKKRCDENFSAFFYSLVSRDTEEMFYSTKRQQFLVDQGYSFKVITDLLQHQQMSVDDQPIANREPLACSSNKEQAEVLQSVLLATEAAAEEEEEVLEEEDSLDSLPASNTSSSLAVKRSSGASALASISGATGMAYMEFNRPVSSSTLAASQNNKKRHPLFKARFGSK